MCIVWNAQDHGHQRMLAENGTNKHQVTFICLREALGSLGKDAAWWEPIGSWQEPLLSPSCWGRCKHHTWESVPTSLCEAAPTSRSPGQVGPAWQWSLHTGGDGIFHSQDEWANWLLSLIDKLFLFMLGWQVHCQLSRWAFSLWINPGAWIWGILYPFYK